jgi:hypothetical protein
MLSEKLQRARPGERGARGVVVFALVAVEAVIGGVDVDRHIRVTTSFTPATGMCWSFSPKCSIVGTRGFMSFIAMIRPP